MSPEQCGKSVSPVSNGFKGRVGLFVRIDLPNPRVIDRANMRGSASRGKARLGREYCLIFRGGDPTRRSKRSQEAPYKSREVRAHPRNTLQARENLSFAQVCLYGRRILHIEQNL